MNKKSSDRVTKLAAEVLQSNQSSQVQKSLAGSVLSQAHTNKQTGPLMESKASTVLKSDKFSDVTKTLAGSVLSQSNKKR